ncbi:methyltransferase [Flavobacteriaceae sp. LMIT009]
MKDIDPRQENGYSLKSMSSKDLEKIVLTRTDDWKFDEHVSVIFDTHVKRSIPCYSQIQELIGIMSKTLLSDNSLVYDLGTATGNIIRSIHNENEKKNIKYIGLDKSLPMIRKAKAKCSNIKNATFYNDEVESFNFQAVDLVVAAFTLQFIAPKKRQSLVQKIYNRLKPRGHFILCEKITFERPDEQEFYMNVHESWKQNHFTKEEINTKKERLKNVMLPFSLGKNLELLNNAGFIHTNVFFKWSNFVCILASKY